MLSRVADSIFWMNRYIERAENVARFIEVNQKLTLGFQEGLATQWEPLIKTNGDEERYEEKFGEYNKDNVLNFLTFDLENPNSIMSCLNMARENARCVRDNLSVAIWESINKFYLTVRDYRNDKTVFENPHTLLDHVKRYSQLIEGATESTMTHGEAWTVSHLGRYIERADKTSRILDVKYYMLLPYISDVGSELDVVQWTALLNSTSALQMYRRKYGRIHPKKVVEFLTLNRTFPRSIHFCLIHADNALHNLSGCPSNAFSNSAEQLLGRMRTNMDYTTLDDIINSGLHEFIDNLQNQLNDLGAEICKVFQGVNSQQQSQTQYS